MLLDKFVNVFCWTTSGAYNNQVYGADPMYPDPVPVNIQPAQPQFLNDNNGEFYKQVLIFTTASGITENKCVTTTDTNKTYIIRGRKDYNFFSAPHYELMGEEYTI